MAAALVQSFDAVAGPDAELLILGSMPGTASLTAGRYYAHPRNAFWPILAELLGFDASCPYEERLAALRSARIALWDVLHSCRRDGSLDTRIDKQDQAANDFAALYRTHPRIRRVLFNGAMAEQCYARHVLASGVGSGMEYGRLPSTSPANASWSFERKLAAWRSAIASPPTATTQRPGTNGPHARPRRQAASCA